MVNKISYSIIAIFLVLIVACNRRLTNTNLNDRDTLKIFNTNFELKEKGILLNEYYSKFGIIIPKYYTVKDSTPIDLNQDNLIDTLVVFSPILIEDEKYSNFKSDFSPSRILVEILNDGKKSKIRNVYENVISNIPGVLSKYSGIAITKNGFVIKHQSGSRYSWSVMTEFDTFRKDSIALIRLGKVCTLDGLEESVDYKLSNMNLLRFNINDTIKNNCNCDSLWKTLEERLENKD